MPAFRRQQLSLSYLRQTIHTKPQLTYPHEENPDLTSPGFSDEAIPTMRQERASGGGGIAPTPCTHQDDTSSSDRSRALSSRALSATIALPSRQPTFLSSSQSLGQPKKANTGIGALQANHELVGGAVRLPAELDRRPWHGRIGESRGIVRSGTRTCSDANSRSRATRHGGKSAIQLPSTRWADPHSNALVD